MLDITDSEAVVRLVHRFRPDLVFHLAGIAFVPEAEASFERALKMNVLGVQVLCSACHSLEKSTCVVLASSGEVYGRFSPSNLPLRESCPVQPASNYSLSKCMAELILPRYRYGLDNREEKVRGVALRLFNHIGPGQDSRFVVSSFARQLAQIQLGKIPPVLKVGNLEALRDFTDVRDVARAYLLAAEKGSGVYNIGSGRSVKIQSILDMLLSISKLQVDIQTDPERTRPAEVPEVRACREKAKVELSWEPLIPLEDSLRATYAYWLSEEG
jgi:GDP-4-dehydro-6-deoxy-D-mannose reductase